MKLFLITITISLAFNYVMAQDTTINGNITAGKSGTYWQGFRSNGGSGTWGFQQSNIMMVGIGGNVYNRGFSQNAMGIFNGSLTKEDVYLYNQNNPGADFLVLKNTGNVGIGTSTPSNILHILGALDGTGIQLQNIGVGGRHWSVQSTGGTSGYGQGKFAIVDESVGARLVINSSGNVGIGTSSPHALFHTQTSNNGLNIIGGFQNLDCTQTGGNAVGIGFLNECATSGSWWKAAIVHERTNGYGVGSLKFLVNNAIDNTTVTLNDAKMTILPSGNVGIGTTNPSAPLHVSKLGNNATGNLTLLATFTDPTGVKGVSLGYNQASQAGIIYSENNTGTGSPLEFWTYNNGTFAPRMVFTQSGNLGIGTTDTQNFQLANSTYKLAVGGNVIAEQVTVKLQANWPDYVFKPTYTLTPLSEVKSFIDQNHHLPEIPSEKEVAEKGLNLGEMNKLLTKKVEELTLYLIEKDKEMKELKQNEQSELNLLKAQLDQMNEKIKTILTK